MNWQTILVLGTMICAPLGAAVIVYGLYRGFRRVFKRPTTNNIRDFTGTH